MLYKILFIFVLICSTYGMESKNDTPLINIIFKMNDWDKLLKERGIVNREPYEESKLYGSNTLTYWLRLYEWSETKIATLPIIKDITKFLKYENDKDKALTRIKTGFSNEIQTMNDPDISPTITEFKNIYETLITATLINNKIPLYFNIDRLLYCGKTTDLADMAKRYYEKGNKNDINEEWKNISDFLKILHKEFLLIANDKNQQNTESDWLNLFEPSQDRSTVSNFEEYLNQPNINSFAQETKELFVLLLGFFNEKIRQYNFKQSADDQKLTQQALDDSYIIGLINMMGRFTHCITGKTDAVSWTVSSFKSDLCQWFENIYPEQYQEIQDKINNNPYVNQQEKYFTTLIRKKLEKFISEIREESFIRYVGAVKGNNGWESTAVSLRYRKLLAPITGLLDIKGGEQFINMGGEPTFSPLSPLTKRMAYYLFAFSPQNVIRKLSEKHFKSPTTGDIGADIKPFAKASADFKARKLVNCFDKDDAELKNQVDHFHAIKEQNKDFLSLLSSENTLREILYTTLCDNFIAHKDYTNNHLEFKYWKAAEDSNNENKVYIFNKQTAKVDNNIQIEELIMRPLYNTSNNKPRILKFIKEKVTNALQDTLFISRFTGCVPYNTQVKDIITNIKDRLFFSEADTLFLNVLKSDTVEEFLNLMTIFQDNILSNPYKIQHLSEELKPLAIEFENLKKAILDKNLTIESKRSTGKMKGGKPEFTIKYNSKKFSIVEKAFKQIQQSKSIDKINTISHLEYFDYFKEKFPVINDLMKIASIEEEECPFYYQIKEYSKQAKDILTKILDPSLNYDATTNRVVCFKGNGEEAVTFLLENLQFIKGGGKHTFEEKMNYYNAWGSKGTDLVKQWKNDTYGRFLDSPSHFNFIAEKFKSDYNTYRSVESSFPSKYIDYINNAVSNLNEENYEPILAAILYPNTMLSSDTKLRKATAKEANTIKEAIKKIVEKSVANKASLAKLLNTVHAFANIGGNKENGYNLNGFYEREESQTNHVNTMWRLVKEECLKQLKEVNKENNGELINWVKETKYPDLDDDNY